MNNENLKDVYEKQTKKKVSRLSKNIGKAFIAVALGFGGGAAGSYFMNNQGTTVVTKTTTTKATGTSNDASSISSKMTQSVVAITTENISRDNFWYGSQVSSGAGSGVIMSSDGYIITCAHVVSGASTIKVTTSDNKTYDATLVGTYSDNDIAVLKINATNLKPATFANSDKLVQGQSTYAVGNPEGTFSDSITSGIVSALNRKITVQLDNDDSSSSNNYGRFGQFYSSSKTISISVIQTDAAVSPGNSGGGLFNGNGDLIGIVNAKSSDTNSEGLGFAIPSNTALKIAKELINKSN